MDILIEKWKRVRITADFRSNNDSRSNLMKLLFSGVAGMFSDNIIFSAHHTRSTIFEPFPRTRPITFSCDVPFTVCVLHVTNIVGSGNIKGALIVVRETLASLAGLDLKEKENSNRWRQNWQTLHNIQILFHLVRSSCSKNWIFGFQLLKDLNETSG